MLDNKRNNYDSILLCNNINFVVQITTFDSLSFKKFWNLRNAIVRRNTDSLSMADVLLSPDVPVCSKSAAAAVVVGVGD